MFVAMARFPVPTEREEDFQVWFAAMHRNEVALQERARIGEVLNDEPRVTKYEVMPAPVSRLRLPESSATEPDRRSTVADLLHRDGHLHMDPWDLCGMPDRDRQFVLSAEAELSPSSGGTQETDAASIKFAVTLSRRSPDVR